MRKWTLKPGYVKPDANDLPDGWVAKQLSSLCDFHQGGKLGLTKEHDYVSSGYPAYSAAGQDGFVEIAEYQNVDAVILSAIGANCGRCFYASGDWTTLANVQVIIPNEKIDAKYLYYRANRDDYWTRSGSAQPFIKPSSVGKSWIAYPEKKNIQHKVTLILDAIGRSIEKTEKLIEKYQQIKAGLMHDLFTRGIGADGQLRPLREQAPELYQETRIGWIPKEWKIKKINELAAPFKGSTVIGPFGSDLVMSDYRSEGTPVIFVRDVKEDNFNWISNVYLSKQKTQQLYAHRVNSEDILATKMGLPPCVSCVYPGDYPMAIITADIIRMTVDSNKVNPYWLSASINHDRVKRQVAAITAGVTRPKVTLADFRGLKIATPSLEEQITINTILDKERKLISSERRRLSKLERQKSGLMHDLLTGKVSVKLDSNDAAHQSEAISV